jgi:hypothetical protein
MRIFVAHGYNSRDRWVEEVFRPIIEAFGSEFVSGGDLGGQTITEGVQALINSSDALIAFATRRNATMNDQFDTHRWVTDELAHAIGQRKRVLEIREDGVVQDGIAGDRQRLTYNEQDKVKCIVQVIQVLGQWHRRSTRRFQLVPDDLIRPHLNKPYFRCTYKVLDGFTETASKDVPVQKITGGLFITASDLSPDSLVQVQVVTDQRVLSSEYTAINAISVKISE